MSHANHVSSRGATTSGREGATSAYFPRPGQGTTLTRLARPPPTPPEQGAGAPPTVQTAPPLHPPPGPTGAYPLAERNANRAGSLSRSASKAKSLAVQRELALLDQLTRGDPGSLPFAATLSARAEGGVPLGHPPSPFRARLMSRRSGESSRAARPSSPPHPPRSGRSPWRGRAEPPSTAFTGSFTRAQSAERPNRAPAPHIAPKRSSNPASPSERRVPAGSSAGTEALYAEVRGGERALREAREREQKARDALEAERARGEEARGRAAASEAAVKESEQVVGDLMRELEEAKAREDGAVQAAAAAAAGLQRASELADEGARALLPPGATTRTPRSLRARARALKDKAAERLARMKQVAAALAAGGDGLGELHGGPGGAPQVPPVTPAGKEERRAGAMGEAEMHMVAEALVGEWRATRVSSRKSLGVYEEEEVPSGLNSPASSSGVTGNVVDGWAGQMRRSVQELAGMSRQMMSPPVTGSLMPSLTHSRQGSGRPSLDGN